MIKSSDDHDDHAGRSDIFLNAAVDHAVFLHIHRLRKETGRYVRHKCFSFRVRKFLELRAVDRIVLTDIDIVRILGYRKVGTVRNIGECLVFR